jgi:hypothetical protein
MSSRPQLDPHQVIPSPNATPANSGSMASNIASEPTIVKKLSQISYSVSWTGTSPVGTISVQGSDDYSQNNDGSVRNPGTWNNLPLSYSSSIVTAIPITGNTGNGMIDIASTGIYALRLFYTAGSGTGNLVAIVNGKVA